MSESAKTTLRMNEEGEVTLPEAMLERLGWRPGMEFTIEDLPEGVLLRPSHAENGASVETKQVSDADRA